MLNTSYLNRWCSRNEIRIIQYEGVRGMFMVNLGIRVRFYLRIHILLSCFSLTFFPHMKLHLTQNVLEYPSEIILGTKSRSCL
jgi:hypothetical protein